MNTTGHDGFDERTDILVLDGSLPQELVVREPGPVGPECHGLVLEQ